MSNEYEPKTVDVSPETNKVSEIGQAVIDMINAGIDYREILANKTLADLSAMADGGPEQRAWVSEATDGKDHTEIYDAFDREYGPIYDALVEHSGRVWFDEGARTMFMVSVTSLIEGSILQIWGNRVKETVVASLLFATQAFFETCTVPKPENTNNTTAK